MPTAAGPASPRRPEERPCLSKTPMSSAVPSRWRIPRRRVQLPAHPGPRDVDTAVPRGGVCLAVVGRDHDGSPTELDPRLRAPGPAGVEGEACLAAGRRVSRRPICAASTYPRRRVLPGVAQPPTGRGAGHLLRGGGAASDPPVEAWTSPSPAGRFPATSSSASRIRPGWGEPTAADSRWAGPPSAEELYFQLGVPGAEEHGGFDGPIRTEPAMTISVPDFEVPVAAVLDTCTPARCRPRTPGAVRAGFGCSSPHTRRPSTPGAALVANPPVVDMGRYMEAWVRATCTG